ncbi:MAG: hypothetical protein GY716_08480 [bacterium]|nr:hypothetical protein [bacterium]
MIRFDETAVALTLIVLNAVATLLLLMRSRAGATGTVSAGEDRRSATTDSRQRAPGGDASVPTILRGEQRLASALSRWRSRTAGENQPEAAEACRNLPLEVSE